MLPRSVYLLLAILIAPPTQPPVGPGGRDYLYSVKTSIHGSGDAQYWLFEPEGAKSAPVVIFLHGWSAMVPGPYELWIEHIVKKGRIVIYPRYQRSLLVKAENFTPNSMEAVKLAMEELKQEGHVKPELDNVAIVGHSAGGLIAANMAVLMAGEGMPSPRALMCVEPGITERNGRKVVPLLNPEGIPDIPMLVVVGDADKNVGDMDAKHIFRMSTDVRTKNYIIVHSDDHGDPPLVADHYAPNAAKAEWRWLPEIHNGVDALDYYGFWKLFDGLCDFAFYGKNGEYAFGNTEEQRFMGMWGDGVAVRELEVYETL